MCVEPTTALMIASAGSSLIQFQQAKASQKAQYVAQKRQNELARANAIETNDMVRKSAYSFELINNKMRVFPKVESSDDGDKIYFHYYLKEGKQELKRKYFLKELLKSLSHKLYIMMQLGKIL